VNRAATMARQARRFIFRPTHYGPNPAL
jgi:hypothetical protein